jgi:low-density lipoprotein receptor-related protein 1 (alpha-2-macroglobulin receptor)
MKNDTKHYEIRYCNMDGSNDTLLVREDEPIQSLSFDSKDRRLYFIKNNRKIFYRDLKTDDLKLVNTFYGAKQSGSDESYDEMFITSLEVFGEFIYFGDNASGTIRKCDKTNCKRPETYRKNTPNIRELKVMALSDSSSDSTDVNGCYMKKEGAQKKCEHLCIPLGSTNYVCKCAIGYEVDKNDPSKCVGYDNFLVYSLGHEMKGINLNSDEQSNQVFFTPLQKVNVISTFDFDAPNDFIYFSDNDSGEILRIKKDGSSRQTIMSSWDNDLSNSDWLGGIAIDWIAQNIYWTDQKRGLIEVSRLDGSFRRVIASQLFRPSKIVVDPLLGLLFFGSNENKIYSLNLDGTALTLVTKKSDITFNDFVIDIGNQTIYFCEWKRNKIWKIDYDGNGRKELNIEHVNSPISLDIIDFKLYWAEKNTKSIKSVNLDNLSEVQTIKKSISNHLKSIKIFSRRKQHGSNPCIMPDYGYCQELCLYNGTKPNCFCSHGYLDPIDQKSCRKYNNYLFISRKENIERISVDGDNESSFTIDDHNLLHNAVALSYDIKHKLIYFSDFKLNAICVSNFQGSRFEKLIENQHHVEGIAFNPQDQHLFWTLNGEAEIRSFDINLFKNGTYLTEDIKNSINLILKLQTGVDKLRAIFVEPCLNMIYYSNWNNKHPSISRIYVTGYGNEDLITTEIFVPNALTLDLNDKKIFWADARLDKIERADYDGKNRVILSKSAPKHPFSIAVFEDFIFWSDWTLHGVLRANKYSGNDVIFIKRDIDHPMGIVVAQDQIKNCTNGLCAVLNGGCEDICLPHGESLKCECSQGYLAKDGKRCLTRNKLSTCNSTFEFECRSGECIPLLVTCDGILHCSDNSDEAINYCATRKCPPEAFFQCRNFKCIFKNETCNGVSECGDGSDEENCTCADDEFKCTSGECMKKKVVCDFDPDCADASDEMGCDVRDCNANPGFDFENLKGSSRKLIPCPKTTACYLKEWECDGKALPTKKKI